jgi:NADPH:quinone reductase-like Zn-dependent oxidoreductase
MTIQNIQAIRVQSYGGPEQLQLEQVSRPTPQAGGVGLFAVQFARSNVDFSAL